MANTKSAKKRVRRNNRARFTNRIYLSKVKTAVKAFTSSVANFDLAKAKEVGALLVSAQSLLAKAAQKGIIKQKNASRKISRMTAALKKVETAKPVEATVTKKKAIKPAAVAAPKKVPVAKAKAADAKPAAAKPAAAKAKPKK